MSSVLKEVSNPVGTMSNSQFPDISRPSSVAVMCIEPGMLEIKSACAILTFRENLDRWRQIPIYAYAPRQGRQPSEWMKELLNYFRVTLVTEPLNVDFVDYPLANKPLAMAHAENTLSCDTLIFLDGDTLFWRDPELFECGSDCDLKMWPDCTKTVASSGPGDRFEPMWQAAYNIAGAMHEHWTTTELTGARVRGWWCSGVVVARRSAGLMRQWLNCFREGVRENIFVAEASYLKEQIAICAVAGTTSRIENLPVSHNYLVQDWRHYLANGFPPEEAALWHYQGFLNREFREFAIRLGHCQTLNARLECLRKFTQRIKTNHKTLVRRDETLIQSIRRRMMLGVRLRMIFGCQTDSDRRLIEMLK
jgi:hypothetical protein